MKNPAFGHWTVEETNWSEKDTAFIDVTLNKKNDSIPTSLKEIKELHESLSY